MTETPNPRFPRRTTTVPIQLVATNDLAVRPAGPHDRGPLEDLLARCSPETLYRRFHAAVGPSVAREIGRITDPTPTYRSWVAEADGAVRGTATLAWGADGIPEAAFLVEDEWFRHGIGRALFAALAEDARLAGATDVVARIQADNHRIRSFLDALAPHGRSTWEGGGEVRIDIPVLPAGVRPHRQAS